MMRRILFALCALLLLWGAGARAGYAQLPTIEEGATLLEAAASALDAGNVEEAEALLGQLNASIEAEPWEAVLALPPAEGAATLRDLAARLREPPTTLPGDSRARLDEILARPEFQDAQPTLLERFLDWLGDLMPDISPDVRGLSEITAGVVGVLVIGFLVGYVVRMVRHYRREGESTEMLGEIPIHATEAQAKATYAAEAGDFREAMRLLYLAALLHLDEVGLLRFDRALTNREVLATVANRAPLYETLAPVVRQFDRVWYGHAPFGAQDFEVMEGQIEMLRQMQGTGKS